MMVGARETGEVAATRPLTKGDEGTAERPLVPRLWLAGFACTLLLMARRIDATPEYGLVFNEMLVRLLHGQFDIPASVIGSEAFVYNGRTYAYFGVFCALLRLPLLLTGHIGVDMTKASVLGAAALSLLARLAATDLALNSAEGLSQRMRMVLLGAVAVGGESLQYLHPSIYQEVCAWGAALASVFVWLAVRRIFGADRRAGLHYAGMALAAGLALICRVSFGLGLYAALGLMLAVEAWRGGARLPSLRTLAPAALVLALFAGVAGGVNAARWGDPLTFIPVRYQLAQARHAPDRLERLKRVGAVNLRRAPFALQYYFTPVWMIGDGKGGLLFQQTQVELFDSVELPPSSFLLSDPVICVLAALGLWTLARRRDRTPEPLLATAAVAGLACPAAVMLTAISLTFRYRMDFYPLLDLAACVGAAALRIDPAREPVRRFDYMARVGALASVATLALYAYSPFGPAVDLDMRRGWIQPLIEHAHGRFAYIGHLLPDGRRVDLPTNGR
jgi:hypothetical protein